ncbi:MAG: hydantoinase/oxoprolinase family protein [Deltaproteobacteria bacterium]
MIQVGIDTGGTFTDFVFFDGIRLFTHKISSTPDDPSRAIMEGLNEALGAVLKDVEIVHGTTVATNALLERKGARIALVTTEGFEDLIEIGRQNRGELYNIFWEAPGPLVERVLRLGISERTTFEGNIAKRIKLGDLKKLLAKLKRLNPEGVAISFLHSYMNSENENRVADYLKKSGLPLSVSSRILPEFREYERTSTIVANAYLLPKVKAYMSSLTESISARGGSSDKITIMQSSGGIISPGQAGEEPVRILTSGPAGGVVGGFKVAQMTGYEKVMTYDMGGTSTDVALCDGSPKFTTETNIDGIPIKVPMIDVHTIGAGGGSVAYADTGGALKVGPRSAGADPGPACYGKGREPAVTDANVLLGRIDPEWFLGGRMKIYPGKSEAALRAVAKKLKYSVKGLAEGVIKVANANMARALRVISIGRGYDPREFALLSFGGAGGLHACELASDMGMKTVIFPVDPGVLSALGMLVADSFKDYGLTLFLGENGSRINELEENFRVLEARSGEDFPGSAVKFERYVDVRYKRQAHEVTVPYGKNFVRSFHRTHKKMYGYMKPESEVEVVTLRLRAIAQKKKLKLPLLKNKKKEIRPVRKKVLFEGREIKVDTYRREDFYPGYKFSGPSLVLESTSTLFITPDYNCEIDTWGNIIARS